MRTTGGTQKVIEQKQNVVISQPVHPTQVPQTVIRNAGQSRQEVRVPPPPKPQVIHSQSQVRPQVIHSQSQVRPPVPQPQQLVRPPVAQTQTVRPPQSQPQPQPQSQVIGAVPSVPPGATQFVQNSEVQRQTQQLLQQKMNLPQNTNVQYQYSTKTVRTLTPEEVRARSSSPQPSLPQRQSTAAFGLQPNRQSAPSESVALKNNGEVDLADSEHINITKSVFHAKYDTVSPSELRPQGNAFSFGGPSEVNRSQEPQRGSGGSVFDYNKGADY